MTDIPGGIEKLLESTSSGKQMVEKYGDDWTKFPTTSKWFQGLNDISPIPVTPPPTPPTPPAPTSDHLTGGHWVGANDYAALGKAGWNFAISEFNPGDSNTMASLVSAAKAAGMKNILGLWPEPYTLNADKATWTITPQGQASLKAMAAEPNVLAAFVFNEPYWVMKLTIPQLRALRQQIAAIAPGLKIYHDIGAPSNSPDEPHGDQSGVCDYAGIWAYPFTSNGTYNKANALNFLNSTVAAVKNQMGGTIPIWLGQVFSDPPSNCGFPSQANLADWNSAIRAALPADALISWYVWYQSSYQDYLKNHTNLLPYTIGS